MSSTTSRRPPLFLMLAVVVVLAQAVALVVAAVLTVTGLHHDTVGVGLGAAVFFLAAAAGLLWCALGLWRCHSWARAPIVLAELICLGLAWDAHASNVPVAALLAVSALLVLVGIFHPRSIDALAHEDA